MSAHLDPIFESPLGGLSHEGDISIHDLTKRHRWGLRGKGAAEALRIRVGIFQSNRIAWLPQQTRVL